jgi:proteasome lid subunit RPN8/RPN11
LSFFKRLLNQNDSKNQGQIPAKEEKKSVKVNRAIFLTRETADGIITFAKSWHPNEGILILRGQHKHKKGQVHIDGLVVPPFASHGPYYSGFPSYDLPFDLSYVGTAHSHPGGSNRPSLQDLNNFFGLVSIIISFPYDENCIGAFDRNGKSLPLTIA